MDFVAVTNHVTQKVSDQNPATFCGDYAWRNTKIQIIRGRTTRIKFHAQVEASIWTDEELFSNLLRIGVRKQLRYLSNYEQRSVRTFQRLKFLGGSFIVEGAKFLTIEDINPTSQLNYGEFLLNYGQRVL